MNNDNPVENLIAAMTPGGIEAQEARGQVEFVAMETLPTDFPHRKLQMPDCTPWQALERLGFETTPFVEGLFQEVKFPEGWKKIATDHSMWSDLVDDKGRIRGNIFYKAAFYDENAHMGLTRYFNYNEIYERHDGYIEDHIQFQITNGEDEVIYTTTPIKVEKHSEEHWKAQDAGSKEVNEWLDEHFPKWEQVLPYWDDNAPKA